MIQLREYQKQAIQSLFDFLESTKPAQGSPCLVIPTGGGKSLIIAGFIAEVISRWEGTSICILTHQKELIEHDAKALQAYDSSIQFGIYAAALNRKDWKKQITFASIQSLANINAPNEEMHFDLVIVDEAHLINNEEKGQYHKTISRINPYYIIGLTATPYRLGQGLLTEGFYFTKLIEPVSIRKLQKDGYLALLRTKGTETHYDLRDVKIHMGEFVQSDLQNAVIDYSTNEEICKEIKSSLEYYKREHLLVFCTGIDHARAIANQLNQLGISAVYVSGEMSQAERASALNLFTTGSVTAMCNANLLTTGFDYPNIDMIAMLRPTMSPGLYSQCLGRGLRLKTGRNKDCLVLDFAGNVERHGVVTDIIPPSSRKQGDKLGAAPMKECPQCLELLPIQASSCPSCGYEFPKNEKLWRLYMGDINGGGYEVHEVYGWSWYLSDSRKTQKPMYVVEYRTRLGDPIKEFILYKHSGFAYRKAIELAKAFCKELSIDFEKYKTGYKDGEGRVLIRWDDLITQISINPPPEVIITQSIDKFPKVVDRIWTEEYDQLRAIQQNLKDKADETRHANFGI